MPISHHVIGETLRRLGLLPTAYRVNATLNALWYSWTRRTFEHDRPDFALPSPKMLFEIQATCDPWRYYLGGRGRAEALINRALRQLPRGPLRICEWGCGAGRVVRHLPSIAEDVTAYGTDYSEELIEWCQQHIGDVTFVRNELEPPLPFPDDSFDFLYSLSVFTHLAPDLQRRWLMDQLRVVRPGGLISFSVHGNAYRERLLPDELSELDRSGVVLRKGIEAGGAWYTTYQTPEQVRRDLIGDLEVLEVDLHETGRHQDLWTVRVPAGVPAVPA
jgi:SAM-dependent methyltransferase